MDCIVHGVAKSQGRLSDFNFTSQRPNEGNGNPLDYSSLENSMDRGAWQAMSMGLQRVGHDLTTKDDKHVLYTCTMYIINVYMYI